MSGNPAPYFSFAFEGYVWKLAIDDPANRLVAEIRDQENREVYFVSIDLKELTEFAFFPETGDDWWVGMEEAWNNMVLLHRFKDENDPEHIGIIGMDARNGEWLWEQPEMQMHELLDQSLLAFRNNSEVRSFLRLILRTGEVEEEVQETDSIKEELQAFQDKRYRGHIYPNHYPGDSEYFNTVKRFLYEETGNTPVKAMDYLEYNGYVIISYYIYEQEQLANYLLLMNESGEVFYHECIGRDLGGIGMDTFFVYNDVLIFIKSKNELLGYAL